MTDDPELTAIRARRLAQLQSQENDGTNMESEMQSHKQQQNAQRDQEQMRAGIIARILTPEARERISRISIVKPERARALEDLLISSARSGQLRGSSPQGLVTESDLVGLLERFTVNEKNTNRITFQRRGGLDDDDDY